MTARKPIEPGCTFGIDCEIDGHVKSFRNGGTTRWSHIKMTVGQRKTRCEQFRAEHQAKAGPANLL